MYTFPLNIPFDLSLEENQAGQTVGDFCDILLAEAVLVHQHPPDVTTPMHTHSAISEPANTEQRQDQPCQPTISPPDSLKFGWMPSFEKSCSKEIQSIVSNIRKCSMRKCFVVKWKRFFYF